MQKIVFILVLFFLMVDCTFASSVNKENPYAMIKEAAQFTFDRFAREEQQIKQNPELLKDIVREELMPYVSYQYAGLKVLGNYRKKASKDEIKAFLKAFREYLITSYAQVFTMYKQQKVVFEPAKTLGKEKIILVGVDIIDGQRPPINIKFKVRKFNQTNEWLAFDLVAEGISLLDAKQKELRSILAQNGVPEVTKMLLEKSQRKIIYKDGEDLEQSLKTQQLGN